MRGQVLGVDRETGNGQISGDDGQRYVFRPRDWSDPIGPSVGALIDFEAEGTTARRIYRQPGTTMMPVAAPPQAGGRNKYIAAILAFLFGMLGVHRFYLGRNGSGVVMLVLSLTVVGLPVSWLWSMVDTIRYLVMPDDEFAARYGHRPQ
ncbi:TM2 domain-containing protein [Hephaestia sp. GCM10023244]|uniref:TM2 domain-containing protein n=1 Tax=unclassified Hephaestia TaxID=2631281 RepID=UPI00207772C3|nr:TM2 domain-containing protein [Hephaestia sp. MAHUQ-44]MCM8732086.1 TM2 domain-containing protein [Hephaestia sp. MAHUQ-44]